MKACLITFRSITPAQRGEKVLRNAGVECAVHRTPRFMQEQGCGYSLAVNPGSAHRCAELLRQGRVPFQKIYLRRESGGYEELTL